MRFVRALVVLLILATGLFGAGGLGSHVATAAPTAIAADAPGALNAEDAATQTRALAEAYNLLLDRYVRPLDTAALLGAPWDNLAKEASGKAVAPDPAPTFVGDRAVDLELMRTALTSYLTRPNSAPDGFVAAHALMRGMVRFVDEGHTYFLDPQQYRDYQSWSRGDNTYVGIGISVSSRNSEPRIVEVYDDTPAKLAGLQAGDLLVRIGGRSVAGLALV